MQLTVKLKLLPKLVVVAKAHMAKTCNRNIVLNHHFKNFFEEKEGTYKLKNPNEAAGFFQDFKLEIVHCER